jgi:allantoin racemase
MRRKIRIFKIAPIARGLENWGAVHADSLAEIASNEVELVQVDLPNAPITSISTMHHAELVAPEVKKAAMDAEAAGYDAVVIGCLLEPGVAAAREAVEIPVVGTAAASLHLASLAAQKFSFLKPGVKDGEDSGLADLVREYGFDNRLASIRSVDVASPLAFADSQAREGLVEMMLSEAWLALHEDGAQAIIGYGGYEIFRELRRSLPVPVINPIQANVIVAEALVRATRPSAIDQVVKR